MAPEHAEKKSKLENEIERPKTIHLVFLSDATDEEWTYDIVIPEGAEMSTEPVLASECRHCQDKEEEETTDSDTESDTGEGFLHFCQRVRIKGAEVEYSYDYDHGTNVEWGQRHVHRGGYLAHQGE